MAAQAATVDPILTGRENLELVGRLHHLAKADARRRADELLSAFDLGDAGDRVARGYSGGMRRRLDLAASPQVLFLDEPPPGSTSGADWRSGRWSSSSRPRKPRCC